MGNDSIVGGNGDDFLYGGIGNDILDGAAGNDRLTGGLGNDTIFGRAGDDIVNFNVSTDGADSVDLGDGSDRVTITAAAAGQVRLTFTSAEVGNGNVNDGGALANQDGGLAVRLQAEGGGDTLTGAVSRFDDEGITFVAASGTTFDVRDLVSGVQRGDAFGFVVLGTAGNDTLVATEDGRPSYINGGLGDDVITGSSANDFLVGGAGNDTLSGGAGNDTFIGGAGNDTLLGGAGNDTALFNVSTDGADSVDLGDGSDLVTITAAAAGQVRLTFTSAEVGNAIANDGRTLANQDGGLAVRLQAEGEGDTLTGAVSRFDDEGITFAAASGTTFDVRDLVSGVQRGDAFAFVTLGTSGNDTLAATEDARPYYFNGGMGNDVITGGSANDFLVGGAGNDVLSGAGGNDTFIGGAGNDVLNGGAGLDRAIFNYTLGSATLGRSADGYITITGSDGTDTLRGIEQFQFSDRTVDVADGNALVDDLFYLNRYGDVAAAGQDADAHYAAYGAAEGRDPNAFFFNNGYKAANQDVIKPGTDALAQYRDAGFRQGRDPGASFDNEYYLARNPDVAAAGVNPLEHYLAYGQSEGRSTYEAIGWTADLKGGAFDAEFYLLSYSDVAAEAAKTGDSFAYARNHFEQYGWREGRDPNAVFDTKGYLNAYADVANAKINPLTHYDQYGWKENRDPSVDFDTSNYLKVYGDVTLTGLNPMQHYLQYGLYEGRSAFADGTFGSGLIG